MKKNSEKSYEFSFCHYSHFYNKNAFLNLRNRLFDHFDDLVLNQSGSRRPEIDLKWIKRIVSKKYNDAYDAHIWSKCIWLRRAQFFIYREREFDSHEYTVHVWEAKFSIVAECYHVNRIEKRVHLFLFIYKLKFCGPANEVSDVHSLWSRFL